MPLKIIVRENGPLAVDLATGDVQLVDHRGDEIPIPPPKPGKTTFTLCRCGHSANKPFCDSTHRRIEWKADPPPSPDESRPAGGSARPPGSTPLEPPPESGGSV